MTRRIMSTQPQMHFTKEKPIVVKPDRNVHGKQIGEGYEFRQGDDYMILHRNSLQEALYLAKMGYDIRQEVSEMKFHGTRNGLKVVDGRESDLLVTAKFLSNDNQDKFGDYMAKVAVKLNEMEPYTDEVAEYLQAVEDKIQAAMIAEKFHDEVVF